MRKRRRSVAPVGWKLLLSYVWWRRREGLRKRSEDMRERTQSTKPPGPNTRRHPFPPPPQEASRSVPTKNA